jgi:two-component system, NarL family, nitrate/nitrite response regulator NarL
LAQKEMTMTALAIDTPNTNLSFFSAKPIQVFVIESQSNRRTDLIDTINKSKSMEVCGHVKSADDAFYALRLAEPTVIILDFPHLEVIRELKFDHPEIPILVLSEFDESLFTHSVLDSGASGYIQPKKNTKEVLQAIEIVHNGGVFKGPTKKYARKDPLALCSNIEIAMLAFLGQGKGPRQIADKLCIDQETVEDKTKILGDKLNLKNKIDFVRYCLGFVRRAPSLVELN